MLGSMNQSLPVTLKGQLMQDHFVIADQRLSKDNLLLYKTMAKLNLSNTVCTVTLLEGKCIFETSCLCAKK